MGDPLATGIFSCARIQAGQPCWRISPERRVGWESSIHWDPQGLRRTFIHVGTHQAAGRRLRRLLGWALPEDDAFAMNVRDVFLVADGRTVFVGEITVGPALIHGGHCELLIGGVPIDNFRIEGEVLPSPRPPNMRAVSTEARVDVDLVRRSLDW